MPRIVVFGSLNMDLSIAAERLPQRGETIAGSGFLANPGGKGANQAVAAARLGAQVRMIGSVGADPFGDLLVSALENAGVDVSEVRVDSSSATGAAVIVRVGGDNRIILSAGANASMGPVDAVDALRRAAEPGDVLVTQGECPHGSVTAVLAAAHRMGMTTVLNAAPAWDVPRGAWSDVDVCCVNETECEELVGVFPGDDELIAEACRRLAVLGLSRAVITLGERGSVGIVPAKGRGRAYDLVRLPAEPCEVVDTTGAGDTYVGAMAAALAEGRDLRSAMRDGSRAAALTVGRAGAQRSIPTAAELAAYVATRLP